jgi:hypothetical protein
MRRNRHHQAKPSITMLPLFELAPVVGSVRGRVVVGGQPLSRSGGGGRGVVVVGGGGFGRGGGHLIGGVDELALDVSPGPTATRGPALGVVLELPSQ